MPLALLLGNWKLILFGVVAVAAVVYHLVAISNARQDGRDEVWAKVEAEASRQQDIAQAAAVAAIEAINADNARRERIVADAMSKITVRCRVDPVVIDAIERLRRSTGAGEGDDTE